MFQSSTAAMSQNAHQFCRYSSARNTAHSSSGRLPTCGLRIRRLMPRSASVTPRPWMMETITMMYSKWLKSLGLQSVSWRSVY